MAEYSQYIIYMQGFMEQRGEEALAAPPEAQEYGAYIRPGRRDRFYKWLGGGTAAYFAAFGLLVSNSEKTPVDPASSPRIEPVALGYGSEQSPNYARAPQVSLELERSLTDRPDLTSEPQVHPILVLPSDAPESREDVNGFGENLINESQDFLKDKAGGLSLRYDTYKSALDDKEHYDISFFRSGKNSAELSLAGLGIIYELRQELINAGFAANPSKPMLIMYKGDINHLSRNHPGVVCGVGTRPSVGPGYAGLISLSEKNCVRMNNIFGIPHEVFHGLDAVPDSAPNSDKNGHSNDGLDILSNSPSFQKGSMMVDPGRDDYWNLVVRYLADNHSRLTVRSRGPGKVRIIGQGNFSNTASSEKRLGQEFNLLAKPAKDARLKSWIGGCATKLQCNLPVTDGQNRLLTAVFVKKTRTKK